MNKTTDIATGFCDAYAQSAPGVLGDQHSFLLNTLERHFPPDGTLLVAGCGGYVLPYSFQYIDNQLDGTNRERVKTMLGEGRMVLLDYLTEGSGGLTQAAATLQSAGFFDHGYFDRGSLVRESTLNPEALRKRNISFLVNNLRDDLRLPDCSVSAIDANLSIHHASVTKRELRRVYAEMYRVLQPGGLLVLGEGNVDMNYPEDKFVQLGQALSVSTPTVLCDERDAEHVLTAVFEPGNQYTELPVSSVMPSQATQVKVAPDGLLHITNDTKTLKTLLSDTRFNPVLSANEVVLPLIDDSVEMDKIQHVLPVNRFYDAIEDRVKSAYAGKNDALVAQIIAGIAAERDNALKGLVEHYMGEEHIKKALTDTGFADIHLHRQSEPFYSITARKK